MFGEAGADRLVWNPGDDTDLDEGGPDNDKVEVGGSTGTETFSATANGSRVRFDEVTPTPFSLDIGTTETVQLNANAGDDRFTATGNLAALTQLVVDGGPGADTISGGNGADVILGGDGADVVDGQQGQDVALLGAGTDTFQWDPGDGSDIVEGQGDADRLVVNAANVSERIDLSGVGSRVRLFRDVANVLLDFDGVESVTVNAAGGADTVSVDDLSGTALTDVVADLGVLGNPATDGQPDTVNVRGTNGADIVSMTGTGAEQRVAGTAAAVTVRHLDANSDRVVVLGQAGDDVVDASTLVAPARVEADGGDGDDILIGGNGDDVLRGAAGDDVLIGGAGTDVLNGGPGNNILLGGEIVTDGVVPTKAWLVAHARTVNGGTVLDLGGREQVTIPGVTADALQQGAAA